MTDKSIFKIAVLGCFIVTSILTVIFVLAGVFQSTSVSDTAGVFAVGGGVSLRFGRGMIIGIAISIVLTYLIVSRKRLK